MHTLTPDDEKRFLQEWQSIQTEFVDEPVEAVKEANQPIKKVMTARGFPLTKFEQRAADISVMYPDVAMEYRVAHEVALEGERGEAST